MEFTSTAKKKLENDNILVIKWINCNYLNGKKRKIYIHKSSMYTWIKVLFTFITITEMYKAHNFREMILFYLGKFLLVSEMMGQVFGTK